MAKSKEYILAQGDEITIGSGVENEVTQFIVTLPGNSLGQPPTDGVHAHYDMRSEVLGQGAFAVVKKAIERATGNPYAIKVIDKKKVMAGVAVEREIDILKKLQHEYVVGLKDFFEDSNNYYLVMDLVTGGDLMDFVTTNGPIPEEPSREIARQVLCAVDYVHSLGISHRDIKPDNILIAQDEPVIVRVSDFGLAKITKSGSQLQTFCGTLAYLAPEIMAKKHSDNSSTIVYSNKVDVWSIGCMLYVILTGYLPFNNSTQQALYQSVLSGKFAMEPLGEQYISDSCIAFLRYILAVDPSKRPSAKEALAHPWFTEYVFDDSQNQGESQPQIESQGFASQNPVVNEAQPNQSVSKAPRFASIKRQPSGAVRGAGILSIRNPEDFVSTRGLDKNKEPLKPDSGARLPGSNDLEIPDVNTVPELEESHGSPAAHSSSNDVIMESPKRDSEHNNYNGFRQHESQKNDKGKKEPAVPTQDIQTGPKSQFKSPLPVGNQSSQPRRKSKDSKSDGKEEDGDSDKDNEDIERAAEEEIRQRVNRVNSSIMQSSLNHNSSPLQVRPFISVVRDMDPNYAQEAIELPIGTWMVLRTLDASIPHKDICLSQPTVKFGRFNEVDNVDVVLKDTRISKMHSVIAIEPSEETNSGNSTDMYKVWLGDWSRNGCYVNGEVIGKGYKAQLQEGDTVYFLKEFSRVEFLGFRVTFIDPKAVISRPNSQPIYKTSFNEDPGRFKGWTTSVAVTVPPTGTPPLATKGARRAPIGQAGVQQISSPLNNKRSFGKVGSIANDGKENDPNGEASNSSNHPTKKMSLRSDR